MRIAVTGASGFVGGYVLRAASSAGLSVRAVVRSNEAAARVRELGAEAVVAQLHPPALGAAFAGADAVVHLAHIGSERERDGQTYESVNVAGTRAVAEAAAAAGVRRIVMLSGLGVARYGLAPRVTGPYFRSKLEAEGILFSSGLEAVALRPSYVLGAGDGFVPFLIERARTGVVELPGDGSYRMQPAAVEDAADAILAAADPGNDVFFPDRPRHRVIDLVGPEPLAVADFVTCLAAIARELGTPLQFELRPVPVEDADAAARRGGWHGMPPDELDCLLCDEVADAGPLQALLGRPLLAVEDALRRAAHAALAASRDPQ
jgi:nucleoside-diphosphate-sugar epimerase